MTLATLAAAAPSCSPRAPTSRPSTRCSPCIRSPSRWSATSCSPPWHATTPRWFPSLTWPARGPGPRTGRAWYSDCSRACAGTTARPPRRATSCGRCPRRATPRPGTRGRRTSPTWRSSTIPTTRPWSFDSPTRSAAFLTCSRTWRFCPPTCSTRFPARSCAAPRGTSSRWGTDRSASWRTSPTAAGYSPPTRASPPPWAGRPRWPGSSSSSSTIRPPSSPPSPLARSTSQASSRRTPHSCARTLRSRCSTIRSFFRTASCSTCAVRPSTTPACASPWRSRSIAARSWTDTCTASALSPTGPCRPASPATSRCARCPSLPTRRAGCSASGACGWTCGASSPPSRHGGPRREAARPPVGIPRDGARPPGLRGRLDRCPAVLDARRRRGGERRDRSLGPRRGEARGPAHPPRVRGPGTGARMRRLRRARARRPARPPEGGAAHVSGAEPVHPHDALGRAPGIGPGQLGRDGRGAGRRAGAGARRPPVRARDRRARVVLGDGRGEGPRREAGSVRRGPGGIPAPLVPRSRRRRGADHAGRRFRGRAGAPHRAVLHGTVAHVGRHHRAGDGGVRAGGSRCDGRAAGHEGGGREYGGGGALGEPDAGRGAAHGGLETPAGARSRDAHAGDGAARAGGDCRGRAGRQGRRFGGGGLYVLPERRPAGSGDRRGPGRRGHAAAGPLGAGGRAGVVNAEQLATRRAQIAGAPDLTALLAHLRERAAPLLARMAPLPAAKALLSVDGGLCPEDGATLVFDPWSPDAHRCPRCGQTQRGERHDRSWARLQHLWLAERAAHLATLAALDGDATAGARAAEILRAYARSYWQYPNQDNVLGPSRLFFSTYLESIWICNYVAAGVLLREAGALDDATARGIGQVADEAANLIGEFDEAFSNRQTWNNAALAAIAGWFEDDELARRAIEGPTGLLAHLMRGFGRDGMWYEGENYHLFALRGLLIGAAWAREAGVDIYAEQQLARRVEAALLAPTRTALPDFTFPARKDSPFGVSLAQPAYAELWEVGLGNLGKGETGNGKRELESWLTAVYRAPALEPNVFESYLHDAPLPRFPFPVSRRSLSWWSLLFMLPELPSDVPAWSPGSVLLESQGLAVLRTDGRYASLECGQLGGGHGHPDRLHLTLHAGGVQWLADPGTGSYVARDLFWYRSTLAHNAPRLDKASQPPGDAVCEAWDVPGEWAWVRGRYGELTHAH